MAIKHLDIHGLTIFDDAESIKKIIDDAYEESQYKEHLEAQLDMYLKEYNGLFKENDCQVFPDDGLLENIENEKILLEKAKYELELIKDLVGTPESISTIRTVLEYTVVIPQKNLAQALITVSGEKQREELNHSIRALNSTYSKFHRLKQSTVEIIQNILKHESHIKALKYYMANRKKVEEILRNELKKEADRSKQKGI